MAVSPRSLIEKLNPTRKAVLEKEAIPLRTRARSSLISTEVLTPMAEGKPVRKVSVDVDDKSQFVVAVE